ncbi:Transmembrane domain-containing protein [Spironucleus salmonicida]|uniref:Transmembrane domain-containing protein n=1 Tax=Spironucleus salmonicida TaxID=348837 RepID=V6LVU3_9EUKA|nr:Transmembrane domain-containing protein [Spironucleus salmonicida]|eukprot:EST47826.1 Transmembrane domain-containing protein [Spironucleus salmonicida]
MANCCCNLLKNLCARITYSVLSVVLIIIIAVLMADSMLTSFAFSTVTFKNETTSITVKEISEKLQLTSFYFNISMPGNVWKIETDNSKVCVQYAKDKDSEIKKRDRIDVYDTIAVGYIPQIGNFSCIVKSSLDDQRNQFYYAKYNTMMAIILAIFIITFVLFFVFMWWCCSGWCGCECCGLCRMCCSEKVHSMA